ncbi:nitroreductase family protein [Gemmatimonadota bacterium]
MESKNMRFSELLLKRRSIRKFIDKPIAIDVLKEIINDSILAPSAGNEQPWKYIIVNNKVLLQRISDNCKKNILTRIQNNPNDYASKYSSMLKNESFNIFYNAQTLIIILGESNVKNLELDCALAASYLMMSATSKGLGTCWINFAKEITDPDILLEIGIPDNHTIIAPIIIGYPAIEPSIPRREKAQILKIIT